MNSNQDGQEQAPTDYRKTHRKHDRNLMLLVVGVLVIGGTGLIGLIWGVWDALQGFLCLSAGAILIVTLWLFLSLVQKWLEDD